MKATSHPSEFGGALDSQSITTRQKSTDTMISDILKLKQESYDACNRTVMVDVCEKNDLNWAISGENVSSVIFDQIRFKPACSAREAS